MSTDKCHTLPDAEVDTLANSFLLRTRDDIARLRALVDRAVDGDWTALAESERISHSIHGAGAMFGYTQLSRAAGAMERRVREILRAAAATRSTSSSAVLTLIDGAEELAKALLATGRGVAPENCMFGERVKEG
jgi:chemotaxis protein histidine kinase CheA